MKKTVFLAIILALTAVGLFAQTLPRLAVAEFTTNINNDTTRADAITVRNLVESQMVGTRKYQIVTRNDIDQLLANQRIQVSSISSAENIQKLQLANIRYIVTGAVDAMGNDYAITVRVLDVSTGQFSHSDNDLMGSGSRDLYNGINTLMSKFNAGMSADASGGIVQGTTSRTYNVGDFGPAGGYIFYDKGVFSAGWRYLEAAPAETEFTAPSGASLRVSGTSTAVGSGRRNTQLIVEYLNQRGESGSAEQLCVSLNFDGFTDWFLPSKDELDLMYRNLKQKRLGSFNNNWYWSSSPANGLSAWVQDFRDGGFFDYRSTATVRAVRAF